jgi:hypothetical protein
MSSLWNIRIGLGHRITALNPFTSFVRRTWNQPISLINFFTFCAYWCYIREIWKLLSKADSAWNEFLKFQRLYITGNWLNRKRASEGSSSKHYDPLAINNFFNALKHTSYCIVSWVLECSISSFGRKWDKAPSWFSTYFHSWSNFRMCFVLKSF